MNTNNGMRRTWLFGPIGLVIAGLLAPYMLLSVSVRRPLSLSESLFFSSTFVRALFLPPSTNDPVLSAAPSDKQAIAFPAPKSSHSSVVAGQRYEVPLPPHTVSHPDRDRIPHCLENHCFYIAFATPEQLDAYYRITLPKAGWEYADRLGDGRVFRKNTIGLLIVDRPNYYRGTKISELAVSIYERKG